MKPLCSRNAAEMLERTLASKVSVVMTGAKPERLHVWEELANGKQAVGKRSQWQASAQCAQARSSKELPSLRVRES
jgi:hypothetical protein